jgi:hypothetical protein
MTEFDPPGFLNDLNTGQRAAWSQWVSDRFDEVAAGDPERFLNDAPRPRFFNPLRSPPAADAQERDISWTAFPRIVQLESASDEQRWQIADASRSNQDEYCEWSVTRATQSGKITRVTFTSEGSEYWRFLGAVNFPHVVAVYREHVSPEVQADDLLNSDGAYNPGNRWNNSTHRGAMHLIQENNTLDAEIELAAAATNVRVRNGQTLTGAQELIRCARYGAPERHSDPHIGAVVNELARANADITLANPIGLCIAGLNTAGWRTPDGSDPLQFWKITRGTLEKALRAVFEVPAERGFTVSDITINGIPIRFGAQIADAISIKLTGLATRIGQSQHPPINGCKSLASEAASAEALPGVPGVEDVLGTQRRTHR